MACVALASLVIHITHTSAITIFTILFMNVKFLIFRLLSEVGNQTASLSDVRYFRMMQSKFMNLFYIIYSFIFDKTQNSPLTLRQYHYTCVSFSSVGFTGCEVRVAG